MLSAVVLICAVTLQDCTLDNARIVMRLPAESGNAAACFMHAQEIVAQTSISHELGADDASRSSACRHRNIRVSADDQMMRVPRRGVAYQTAQ